MYREMGVERELGQKLVVSRVQSVRQYQQQISELQVSLPQISGQTVDHSLNSGEGAVSGGQFGDCCEGI